MTIAQQLRKATGDLLDLVTQHEPPTIVSEDMKYELRRLDASVVALHALVAGGRIPFKTYSLSLDRTQTGIRILDQEDHNCTIEVPDDWVLNMCALLDGVDAVIQAESELDTGDAGSPSAPDQGGQAEAVETPSEHVSRVVGDTPKSSQTKRVLTRDEEKLLARILEAIAAGKNKGWKETKSVAGIAAELGIKPASVLRQKRRFLKICGQSATAP